MGSELDDFDYVVVFCIACGTDDESFILDINAPENRFFVCHNCRHILETKGKLLGGTQWKETQNQAS